jgi:hypothetical protein
MNLYTGGITIPGYTVLINAVIKNLFVHTITARNNILSSGVVRSDYDIPVAKRGLNLVDLDMINSELTIRDDADPYISSSISVTASVTASTKKYIRSSGSWISDGISIGNFITFTGYSNAGNNGRKTVTGVSALELIVSEAGLVNETAAAVAFTYAASKYRETIMGPANGLKVVDANDRVIHDTPDLAAQTSDYVMGHLYLHKYRSERYNIVPVKSSGASSWTTVQAILDGNTNIKGVRVKFYVSMQSGPAPLVVFQARPTGSGWIENNTSEMTPTELDTVSTSGILVSRVGIMDVPVDSQGRFDYYFIAGSTYQFSLFQTGVWV